MLQCADFYSLCAHFILHAHECGCAMPSCFLLVNCEKKPPRITILDGPKIPCKIILQKMLGIATLDRPQTPMRCRYPYKNDLYYIATHWTGTVKTGGVCLIYFVGWATWWFACMWAKWDCRCVSSMFYGCFCVLSHGWYSLQGEWTVSLHKGRFEYPQT